LQPDDELLLLYELNYILVSEGAPTLSSPLMLFSISYLHRNSNINIEFESSNRIWKQNEYGKRKEKKQLYTVVGT